jgi:hypothetical protein
MSGGLACFWVHVNVRPPDFAANHQTRHAHHQLIQHTTDMEANLKSTLTRLITKRLDAGNWTTDNETFAGIIVGHLAAGANERMMRSNMVEYLGSEEKADVEDFSRWLYDGAQVEARRVVADSTQQQQTTSPATQIQGHPTRDALPFPADEVDTAAAAFAQMDIDHSDVWCLFGKAVTEGFDYQRRRWGARGLPQLFSH